VVVAKTEVPDKRLPGTIYSAAEAIEKAGGRALAIATDIRSEEQVKVRGAVMRLACARLRVTHRVRIHAHARARAQAAVAKAVETFGGIDICINNASAIHLTPTEVRAATAAASARALLTSELPACSSRT
jgi:citronellol/citronellal dehydrogenase